MHSRKKRATAAASLVVAGAVTAGVALLPPLAGAADAGGAPPGTASTVTLVTGDEVLLDGEGGFVGMRRAEGRGTVPFSVRETSDGLLVVPLDAAPLIRQGVLDARLFDVTELSRPAYDRLADGGTPVIVTYGDGGGAEARAELHRTAGAEESTPLESIDGEALTLAAADAARAWRALTDRTGAAGTTLAAGVSAIALDGVVEASLDVSVPQIGAPAAWEAGYDGTGVDIAVLDTGIDTSHPDLGGGKVIAEQDFSGSGHTGDVDGHGTHVASTAAGTGAMSDGTYTGVAPGAELINAKVLGDDGYGSTSAAIEGAEWAVAQGADVVNMSFGIRDSAGVDPLEDAVNRLSEETGTLFVAAAGNDGPRDGTVGSPASADAALAVGAVDDADALADFSSRGPRIGDGALKPDLTAPGVGIGAAVVEGSRVSEEGEPVAEGYAAISGTSMASPHVTGAAALLAQARPDWTGEQLKAALVGSTAELPEPLPAFAQGSGRVDVAEAMGQTVVAEPVSLSFGTAAWPHGDDEPLSRELTYRNLGDADITLDVAVEGLDPAGNPAPEGMFSADADQITVPAGGTASVTVTADTTLGGDVTGAFSVAVTASGDGRQIRTAGAVEREEEMYDLTIEAIGRDGAPRPDDEWGYSLEGTDGTLVAASDVTTADVTTADAADAGTVTLRVPPGEYFAVLDGLTFDADGFPTSGERFVQPLLEITEDTVITFDARQGEAIDLSVFDENAQQTDVILGHDRSGAVNEYLVLPSDLEGAFRTRHLGPELDATEFSSFVATGWEGGAARYHASYPRDGSYFTGVTEHLAEDELAELDISQGSTGVDRVGDVVVYPENSPATGLRDFLSYEEPLPRETTEYVRADSGEWVIAGVQYSPDLSTLESDYQTPSRTYAAGEAYDLTVNVGVIGPDLTADRGLYRQGDLLYADLGPFTDGQGNSLVNGPGNAVSITLYRNGEEYATEADARHCGGFELPPPELNVPDCVRFQLPPEDAEYELVTTIGRAAYTDISTEVTTAVTFASGHVAEDVESPLPASVVRFAPELALDNTAPAGERIRIPVTVQGAAAGDQRGALSVEVSLDGGETWQDAPVRKGAIRVTNPAAWGHLPASQAGGGSVSLRAEVADLAGNTTVQTIMDAYRTA